MTTTTPGPRTAPLPTPADLNGAITRLHNELGRSDSKASLLLALTGGGLAALVSIASGADLPRAALAVGTAGAVALLAATLVLLRAVRPNLTGPGWPRWTELTDDALRSRVAAGHSLDEVRTLATITHTKFRRIRIAVDLAYTALVLVAIAAAIAA